MENKIAARIKFLNDKIVEQENFAKIVDKKSKDFLSIEIRMMREELTFLATLK